MAKKVVTNDGKKGGWLVGKRHYDQNGKPLGGIKAVVTDAGGKPVELEGGEVIINREASKKHWKELSRINQSAGNGVAIEPPSGAFDEDPAEDYENGGKIEFNANHIPNKWILNYAIKIKEEHKDVWDLGGNIFGNQAFVNLKRVANRGYWLDSEEWMYKKWRSYVARHQRDYRIEGVIAMLKWVDKVEKGWQYMKNLIEEEIKKREAKKSRKMSDGGRTPAPLKDRIKGSKFNPKGTASTSSKAESIKFDDKTISSIQSLIDDHNEKYPSKKITLAVAKAVVRRGMGAYSSSHRPTITGGKPNSRTAWGLARLKAFIHKAEKGKSKSGKYSQDNDLFEELNISVQKMSKGGHVFTQEEQESFDFWIEDGNVIEVEKDVYATQDAMYSNRLKGMKALKDYFYKEYLSQNYKHGGELEKGIRAEHEHASTINKFKRSGISSKQVATAIAKDHLKEDPHYYSKIEKIEGKKFQKGGSTLDINGQTLYIGEIGTYGRKKEHITITGFTAKLVKFQTADGKQKGIYFDDFIKNYSSNLPKTSESTDQYVLKKPIELKDLADTKIKIDSAAKSKAFQKAAFDLGIEWNIYGKNFENEDAKYLFVREDDEGSGKQGLGFSNSDVYFNKKAVKEIYFDDLFELKSPTINDQSASQQTEIEKTTNEIANYRMKTLQELKNEFGSSWRVKAGWVGPTSDDMDWLFGKRIIEIVDNRKYDEILNKILNKKKFNTLGNLDINSYEWLIYPEAYKYDPILSKESTSSQSEIENQVSEDDVKSEKDILFDQYNDILFLISITPTTDVDNMLSLKQQASELKTKLDLIDLELRKKAQSELTLLDELFNASSIQPQPRYTITPYVDGFAPNGQPTKLPKSVYDWSMTDEFQNWFGNFTLAYNYKNSAYENIPCSVVVNDNYEPEIVYHGTGAEFSFFKFDNFPAMYFAQNPDYSNWFAELKGQQSGNIGYVYPFVLNMRSPLDLTIFRNDELSYSDFTDWVYLQTGLTEDELKINKALTNPLQKFKVWMFLRNSPEMLQMLRDKKVCDGIIFYEDNPSVDKASPAFETKAFIIFESNAAKIADPERHISTIPAMRSFYLKRGGKL